jgi:hypothetical protein
MKKCIYGCENPGIFEGKGFYGKGKFRCSENWTQCPVHRKQISERVKKIRESESQEKKLETSIKRKHTMSLISENGLTGLQMNMLAVAKSRRQKDGTYFGIDKTIKTKRSILDDQGRDIYQLTAIKTAETRFGVYAGLKGKTAFEIYRYHVIKFTKHQPLNTLVNFEKRAGYGKSKDPYQLDHKFSTVQGFLNNIPPYIIGHISNLQMLPSKENNSKGSNCSITKEALFESFFNSLS